MLFSLSVLLPLFYMRYKRPYPDRLACLFLDKLQAQTLAYYFFVFSQEVPDCIISKHHQTRLGATKDFIFPEVSAPRSFPPATKECLFFLKLDGLNCCGTTAKHPTTPTRAKLKCSHTHTHIHTKSLRSGWLIMLMANCSTMVICLLRELMCFLLLRHKQPVCGSSVRSLHLKARGLCPHPSCLTHYPWTGKKINIVADA